MVDMRLSTGARLTPNLTSSGHSNSLFTGTQFITDLTLGSPSDYLQLLALIIIRLLILILSWLLILRLLTLSLDC